MVYVQHVSEYTMLVGLTRQYFRCITCGADLEQHVNGKIRYIPRLEKTTLQSVVDGYFNNGKKAKFGLVTAPRQRPRKRPGRHKKSPNKHEKRMGKHRR